MSSEILKQITYALVEGDPDMTATATKDAIDAGLEPLVIVNEGLVPGMNIVGEKFQTGEFFLPNLIIAASGMKQAMDLLEPLLKARDEAVEMLGTVVIGTVQGDIHEIGKSLVATMLSASGFKVYDLGVDVKNEEFVSKIIETNANVVGLSALLTTTMTEQKRIIEALVEAGIRQNVKVVIGGAPVSAEWSASIGADGYAEDAVGAISLIKRLLR